MKIELLAVSWQSLMLSDIELTKYTSYFPLAGELGYLLSSYGELAKKYMGP